MSDPSIPGWQRIHSHATVVDVHAHPAFNVSLFHRLLTSRLYPSSRAFDPFSVRTNFPGLKQGGVDVMLSVIHPPERGILEECPPLNMLRYVMPRNFHRIYDRPYFEVALDMMDQMEEAVKKGIDPDTGHAYARFAHNRAELDGDPGAGGREAGCLYPRS